MTFRPTGCAPTTAIAGAGGRELNVYVDSFIAPGIVTGAGASGRFHPYITSGCDAQSNDFDWDGSPSPGIAYSSVDPDPASGPAARFTTGPLPTSANGTWLNQTFGGWSTDESAQDYGIWSLDYRLVAPNVGVLYVGDFNSAGPPPGSQPEPDTFRIYLPTDAGGPPVKPQIGQGIINIVSGVDPPASNQTTVLRIAVAINNPTPYAVTFAAPNEVVSVQVPVAPGNRVRYQGNPSVTQGAIVSQPLVDGTGTITWNPGVMAPGATAQLEYDLSVRPRPVDTRVVITGTPATNGTTATYVDETCSGAGCSGPQLTRATQTLGPLCELAVTSGVSLATRAVIDGLRAYGTRRGVVVEWTTLAEHGTVGFHLLRLNPQSGEYERVNHRLLPGLLHSRHGGTYRYIDAQAKVGEMHSYRLVELEASGNRLEYGPFAVIVADKPKRARGRRGSLISSAPRTPARQIRIRAVKRVKRPAGRRSWRGANTEPRPPRSVFGSQACTI